MRSNSNTSVRPNPEGDWPQVDTSAYIDSTAQLIGSVRISPRVYVGPNAVVRADEVGAEGEVKPIEIRARMQCPGRCHHSRAGRDKRDDWMPILTGAWLYCSRAVYRGRGMLRWVWREAI